jgi:uncharacterized membrane protein (DUF485 family)
LTSEATTPEKYLEVQRSADFVRLRHKVRSFVFPMTVAFFLWYALYVLLSAYARDFMSVKLFGNINVALVLGLLQFVSTFVIAWYYSRYAAKELDPLADKIFQEIVTGVPVAVGAPATADAPAADAAADDEDSDGDGDADEATGPDEATETDPEAKK